MRALPELQFSIVLDDPDTGGFFSAAAEQHLVVRHCTDCGTDLHPPRQLCRNCQSWNTGWRQLAGEARVLTWTTVTRPLLPNFETPYTVLIVEPVDAPGVRFLGWQPGDASRLRPGMLATASFGPSASGGIFPNWEPHYSEEGIQ